MKYKIYSSEKYSNFSLQRHIKDVFQARGELRISILEYLHRIEAVYIH